MTHARNKWQEQLNIRLQSGWQSSGSVYWHGSYSLSTVELHHLDNDLRSEIPPGYFTLLSKVAFKIIGQEAHTKIHLEWTLSCFRIFSACGTSQSSQNCKLYPAASAPEQTGYFLRGDDSKDSGYEGVVQQLQGPIGWKGGLMSRERSKQIVSAGV